MPFPSYIDNTIRKSFAVCPMKMKRAHIDNLRPTGLKSVDLTFGSAFAIGMETTRKFFFERSEAGAAPLLASEAIDLGAAAALKSYLEQGGGCKGNKTPEKLVKAIWFYFEQWPLGEDGLTPLPNGIEWSFSLPLGIGHPVTGATLNYVGRCDMVATDAQGRIYCVDEKTASRLGESWDMKWDMDTQMTGYIWAQQELIDRHKYGEDVEVQALVRGISILKDGFGHVEIPIVRSQWFIEQWYNQLLRDVRKMVWAYERGVWDMAMHENACVQYMRRCDYMPLCCSPNAEQIAQDRSVYKIEVWNPTERGTT